jgi:CDP-glycerol glycerophosphotransferase
MVKKIFRKIKSCVIFFVCRCMPLQNKVVATTFRGRKYGDNTKYIVENLHKIAPEIEIVWLKDEDFDYEVPDYIRVVPYYSRYRRFYEYATAKVWINTHRIENDIRKRKGQMFIETWHGGLGIKKIEGDVPKVLDSKWEVLEISNTARLADLFISNSKHLTNIYRRAFNYQGKIWKCGYPKNDMLMSDCTVARKTIRKWYSISNEVKIMLYAPTFRDCFWDGQIDISVYDIGFKEVCEALNKHWDGEWKLFIRWHPVMANAMSNCQNMYGDNVVFATDYPDMQELIMGSDAMISDYSSCIFDAALRKIPCLTFATDFDEYKKDRGVYYEMEELPFPYAKNKEELSNNIKDFNYNRYLENWNKFCEKTGYYESGHAGSDIAEVINMYIKGNTGVLEEIKGE